MSVDVKKGKTLADLREIPSLWRQAVVNSIIEEVSSMEPAEIVMLFILALEQDELDSRAAQVAKDEQLPSV